MQYMHWVYVFPFSMSVFVETLESYQHKGIWYVTLLSKSASVLAKKTLHTDNEVQRLPISFCSSPS